MRAVANVSSFSGLVISVKDNLTLQMKLMYKKNKIQSEKISKLKADREQHQVCSQLVKIHGRIGVPSGKSLVVSLQIMVQAQPPHKAIGPLGPSVKYVDEEDKKICCQEPHNITKIICRIVLFRSSFGQGFISN